MQVFNVEIKVANIMNTENVNKRIYDRIVKISPLIRSRATRIVVVEF